MNRKLQRFFSSFGSNGLYTSIHNEEWDKVKLICDVSPKEAKRWSLQFGTFDGKHDSRVLPLHGAILVRSPPHIIESIIEAYPKGLEMKETGFSRLPIHLTCRVGGSLEVLRILLQQYPKGAEEKDILGRIPLHYAISNGAYPEIIDELLRVYPDGVRCFDLKGWLPLHVACDCGASFTVIKNLLHNYPESACSQTLQNNSPLTLLKRGSQENLERIRRLLNNTIEASYDELLRQPSVLNFEGYTVL